VTEGEIQTALRLVSSALQSAQEAERWSQAAVNNDRSNNAQMAWKAAQAAVSDLNRLHRQLRAARSS
jgi:hypothetical protein